MKDGYYVRNHGNTTTFVIDGHRLNLGEALRYLLDIGFKHPEAMQYLRDEIKNPKPLPFDRSLN